MEKEKKNWHNVLFLPCACWQTSRFACCALDLKFSFLFMHVQIFMFIYCSKIWVMINIRGPLGISMRDHMQSIVKLIVHWPRCQKLLGPIIIVAKYLHKPRNRYDDKRQCSKLCSFFELADTCSTCFSEDFRLAFLSRFIYCVSIKCEVCLLDGTKQI